MGTNKNLASDSFQKQLAFGQIAETDIARWLMSRGWTVLHIYDIEYDTGKGPRVFQATQSIVAPDLLTFKKPEIRWIEAKHKQVFTWTFTKSRWVTGIDLHHYRAYQKVQSELGLPIWLLFLHRCSTPAKIDSQRPNCPKSCPTGLFGDSLEELEKKESHRSDNYGKHGMVYWAHESLRFLAKLEDVQRTG